MTARGEVFDAWMSADIPRMVRALPLRAKPLDRHFLLMTLCRLAYSQRKVDPEMRRLATEIGLVHIREFPSLREPLRKELGLLPRVSTFAHVVTLLAEAGDHACAIGVCEEAIGHGLSDGTKGDYQGRIAKLRKASAEMSGRGSL
jgi:hypothetical protein